MENFVLPLEEGFIDYDRIINEMPKNLTKIEMARYIYIQLGRYFSYDEKYFTSKTDEEKLEIFNRTEDDIVNYKAICSSLSKIYVKLLEGVGIEARTVIIPGGEFGHGFTEMVIDDKTYCAHLAWDLMNIKKGFKTTGFMIDYSSRFVNQKYQELQEEELKRIDDKIEYTYKRFLYGRNFEND